jgi:hypothetical protein
VGDAVTAGVEGADGGVVVVGAGGGGGGVAYSSARWRGVGAKWR